MSCASLLGSHHAAWTLTDGPPPPPGVFVPQFDYEAVANRLFEVAGQQDTPSLNRKRLYKVIRKYVSPKACPSHCSGLAPSLSKWLHAGGRAADSFGAQVGGPCLGRRAWEDRAAFCVSDRLSLFQVAGPRGR